MQVMYIEKKLVAGRPYYYAREKTGPKGGQNTKTVAYLGKNILTAYLRLLLIKLRLIVPEVAP